MSTKYEIPCPPGLAFMPFQIEAIEYALQRDATLFASEMGLGKSIMALGVINASPRTESVLVICPASLRINWAREAERWLTREFNTHVVDSGKAVPPPDAQLVIVNYDLVHRAAIFESLIDRRWDCLVVDECHLVKSPRSARRAKAVLGDHACRGLIHLSKRKLFLSGTPIPNGKADELWPILQALSPHSWGNRKDYMVRYAGAYLDNVYIPGPGQMQRTVWKFNYAKGKKHLPELQAKMRELVMVRHTKEEVLTELPAKRRQIIPILPGTAQARRLLRQESKLAKDLIANVTEALDAEDYDRAIWRLTPSEIEEEENFSKLRNLLSVEKAAIVIDHLETILDARDPITNLPITPKVVVFGYHRAFISALVQHFDPSTYVVLDGSTPAGRRQAAIDQFQADEDVRLFVGQIQAAGVGITLTAASNVVIGEMSWVPGENIQAEDRCHRIGQEESVLVQYLVFNDSLDALVARVVDAKAKRIDLVMGD